MTNKRKRKNNKNIKNNNSLDALGIFQSEEEELFEEIPEEELIAKKIEELTNRNNWLPIAYILFLENKICKTCGEEYISPARSIRVKLKNKLTRATKTISIEEFSSRIENLKEFEHLFDPLPTLPSTIETVKTQIQQCPNCFKEYNSSQLHLFPRPAPRGLPPLLNEAKEKLAQDNKNKKPLSKAEIEVKKFLRELGL